MFNLTLYKQCWYRLIPRHYDTRGLLLHLEENLVCLSALTFFLRNYLIMLPLIPFLAAPWEHSFLCCLSKKVVAFYSRSHNKQYYELDVMLTSPCFSQTICTPCLCKLLATLKQMLGMRHHPLSLIHSGRSDVEAHTWMR